MLSSKTRSSRHSSRLCTVHLRRRCDVDGADGPGMTCRPVEPVVFEMDVWWERLLSARLHSRRFPRNWAASVAAWRKRVS
jgi:hypothetical protein